MTQLEKDFCETCAIHDSCGYVSRELEYKCEKIDIFSMGEDAILDKACEWLEENIDSYLSSVTASLGYSDYVLDWNFINDFKKAMKGE